MLLTLVLSTVLASAVQADLPRSLAQEPPKQDPLRTDPITTPAPHGFVDFEWLELTPSAGFAVYSSKYLADPAPAFSIRAHAPMPWLSPKSDPKGDYFGLFAEAAFATIDRKMSPSVADRSGVCMFVSAGVDFSFLRDPTWILTARAGGLYAHYNNIADLKSGLGPMVGATIGVQLSGRLALTYSPEVVFGESGSTIFFNTLGLLIQL
jgi:hypothetical protein